jgi:hypothetical protein
MGDEHHKPIGFLSRRTCPGYMFERKELLEPLRAAVSASV